ncbi:MAG: HAD-IIB family hydrolase [Clostridia bacterium]|nr:HAD-IIB family hydrolase [Clostridia bacterium]
MKIFENCLLLSDVDGTLFTGDKVPEYNVRQIERFINDGGAFAIATGRNRQATQSLLKVVKNNAPTLLLNGAMIYDFNTEQVLFSITMNDSVKGHVQTIMSNPLFSNVGIDVHTEGKMYNLRKTYESEVHRIYEHLELFESDFDSIKNQSWNKVMYLFQNEDNIDALCSVLENTITEHCDYIRTSACFAGQRFYYVEVLPKNVNKGNALGEYRKIFGEKIKSIYCIGDYYNDLSMIINADIGAATGNAPDDIKKVADYVTVDCKDGAVGDFIEYLYRKERV